MTLRLGILLIYSALLLGSSLVPMPVSPSEGDTSFVLEPSVQNLLHIPAFAVLLLLLASLFKDKPAQRFHSMAMIAGIAFVVGIVMELIQIPVPGRYTSFLDIALNCIGIITGIAVYYVHIMLYQHKTHKT